jgi:anti-anti-sigma factor
MRMGTFEVLERGGDTVVVKLEDATGLRGLADLRWRLDTLLSDGASTLIVDVTDLECLSSSTLAALLQARRICRARGGSVVLRGPDRHCSEMLARTALLGLFRVDATSERPDPVTTVGGGTA